MFEEASCVAAARSDLAVSGGAERFVTGVAEIKQRESGLATKPVKPIS
jgi:hypothetical protein